MDDKPAPQSSSSTSSPTSVGKGKRRSFLPLLLAAAIVISDQYTKWLVQTHLTLDIESKITVIPNFFDIVRVHNTGAAFGALSDYTWLLTLVSFFMLGLIILFRRAFFDDSLLHRIILGLLIGGIIGNLIDRVKDAYVTDFLHFYIGEYAWPSFNIADAAICVAVGLYLISSIRGNAVFDPVLEKT